MQHILTRTNRDLPNGNIPLGELVVTQNLSRKTGSYNSPSPAAQAALQGEPTALGQFMRFMFVHGGERVRAWELGIDVRMVDVERDITLLDRAVEEIQGMVVTNNVLILLLI